MKKIIFIFLSFLFIPSFGASLHGLDGNEQFIIDAAKNARQHSNMGNIYFQQNNFISALKEYQIAYDLAHNLPSSSVYLYNIARCYMTLGYFKDAKSALLAAIDKECINITYYEALVDCYIALNTSKEELQKALKDRKNPYNRIIAGLIYLKTGNTTNARIIFDEFVDTNPDMIITNDVVQILNKIK